MATVDYNGAYIHDGSDLSSYVYLSSAKLKAKDSKLGSVEAFAGNRLRNVVGEAEPRQVTIEVKTLSKANRETLEGWVGDLIMYRGNRGRMFYGVFHTLGVTEIEGDQDLCKAKLSINQVTKSIEV